MWAEQGSIPAQVLTHLTGSKRRPQDLEKGLAISVRGEEGQEGVGTISWRRWSFSCVFSGWEVLLAILHSPGQHTELSSCLGDWPGHWTASFVDTVLPAHLLLGLLEPGQRTEFPVNNRVVWAFSPRRFQRVNQASQPPGVWETTSLECQLKTAGITLSSVITNHSAFFCHKPPCV